MNGQQTNIALAQKIRTFADDVRRIKERTGAMSVAVTNRSPASRTTVHTPSAAVPSVPVVPPEPVKREAVPRAPSPMEHLKMLAEHHVVPSPSHLSDEQTPLDIRREAGDAAPESTIIRETRQKRWSLGKALGNSFTAWVDDQKNTVAKITEKQGLKPAVPPSSTRETVIQAARQQSAIAAKDDRHIMVEKLRTFAHDARRVTGKSYTLTHDAGVPRWSSVEEPAGDASGAPGVHGQPSPIKQARETIRPTPAVVRTPATPSQPVKLLEKDVAPAAEQSLPETTFIPAQQKERVVERRARMSAPLPYGIADVAATTAHIPVAEKPATAEKSSAKTETPDAEEARAAAIARLLSARTPQTAKIQKEKTEAPSRDIPFTPTPFEKENTTTIRTYQHDAIEDVAQNKRSVADIAAAEAVHRAVQVPRGASAMQQPSSATRPFVVAGIMMAVIIALGGFGFFWYVQENVGEDIAAVRVPTFMTVDAQKPVPFSTNRAQLLDTLLQEVRVAGSGITQLYPGYTDGQTGKPGNSAVTTTDFMYVLEPRAPGSFIRNLSDEMMFGAYNATDPFFILKTKQFDTAFAGMLDWEPYISVDLTPLFGTPVSRTQDLTVRTVDQTRAAHFADDTIQNMDVRVLYDETGVERLLYAFPDKETLLITTSSSALTALIDKLQ